MAKQSGRTDSLEREKRIATVERAMVEGLWNMKFALQLATRWNTSKRTVSRYRAIVEQRWREEAETTDPLAERVDFLKRLRDFQKLARDQKDLRAASSMLHTEARVLQLEKIQVQHEIKGDQEAPLAVTFAQMDPAQILKHLDREEDDAAES